MTLLAAATVGDDIVHTPLLGQILKVATTIGVGLLAGAAIGFAATLIVGSGGLGVMLAGAIVGALIGAAADKYVQSKGAKSLDDWITKPIFDAIDEVCPGEVKGQILTGSSNVYINGLMAARAAGKPDPGFAARQAAREAAPPPGLFESIAGTFVSIVRSLFGASPDEDFGFVSADEDKILCSNHPPHPDQFMAQGSASVFINGQPAVRVTDKSTCEGKVSINPGNAARRNVSIGGELVQVRAITSEMPPWLERISHYAGIAIGLCQALRGGAPRLNALGCFGLNMVLGVAADAIVRGTGTYLSGQMGHPVHLPTGAKILNGGDDQDFALDARLPVEWTRYYNSTNVRTGLFGTGWSVLYDLELLLDHADPSDPHARHVFIDLQGRRVPLPGLAAGQKFHVAQEGLTFAHTPGGHYMVQFDDGLVIDFGRADDSIASGATLRPWAIEDRNGNAHYLRYDNDGRLTAIATDCGQYLTIEYDTHHTRRVSAIHAEHGVEHRTLVRYAYDAHGNLSEVSNSEGEALRKFAYDNAQRMCMQRLPQGLEVHYQWQEFEFPGYSPHARVVRYTTTANEQVEIRYNLSEDGSGKAHSVDQLGRSHAWCWDALRRITEYRNPVGGCFTLEWAAQARYLLSVTNPGGGISRFAYDERGNLVQETDPLGLTRKTRWHQQLSEPLEHTASDGARWEWQYDAVGNLVHETAPGGLQQHWTHDEHGAVIVHQDARGGIQQYSYDSQGRLLQATDCSHRTTRYEYDSWGRLTHQVDAAGQFTQYRYDEQGRLQSATLPDGMQQAWSWRRDGLPHSQDRAGAVTRYQWSATGELEAVTDPVGNTTRWNHDRAGRVVALIDGRGAVTRFEHDAADRLVAQTGIDGLRTEYRLDACGQPIGVTQAAGTPDAIHIELHRDAVGRLLCKLTPETLTRYTYDGAGRLTGVKRRARDFGVTLADRPEAEWPIIDEIAFTYDEAGRTVAEAVTVHRLLQETRAGLPATWRALDAPRRTVIQREYDALDNPIRVVLPGGQELDYLYYGSGHLHQLRFAGQVVSDIERDALHREVSRSQGALLSEFQLDPVGRVLAVNAKPQVQAWTPGQPRMLVHIRQPADELSKRYAYSPQGNLLRKVDSLLGEQHFVHDAAGQVLAHDVGNHTAVRNPLLASNAERFKPEAFNWDAAGNALPASGTHSAGRVENNRVLMWQDIRYSYDAHGRMVLKQAGSRSTMRLEWNTEHQLIASVTERHGMSAQKCRYHYDALGRRIAKSDGFAMTWFVWEGLRMVQEQQGSRCMTMLYEDARSHAPLACVEHGVGDQEIGAQKVLYFHNDLNGAPEELTDQQGHVVWRARYKTWGNTLVEEWDVAYVGVGGSSSRREQNIRFQGQYFDEETRLHYNTFRYFDPDIGRFACQDPIGLNGGLNLYQYAPNPTEWVDPLGWDWNYHLSDGNGNVYYHGRAGDNQSMADVARRHGNTIGTDGARFGEGDTMTRITEPGLDRLTAQGIEGIGVSKTGKIGRRAVNGDRVRGNNIHGVDPATARGRAKLMAGEAYLQGRSPSAMTGKKLKGKGYTKGNSSC